MSMDYPKDADGDALRRVANDGSDMAAPMSIDFIAAAPDRAAAEAIGQAARGAGFDVSIRQDDPGSNASSWTCTCTRSMVADYDDIVATQAQIDRLAQPHGGHADGWGTFGNA